MDHLYQEQPPPSSIRVAEEMKCRSHPSQVAVLFLNESNQTDLFKCLLCLWKDPSLASKVISVSQILTPGNDRAVLNLCCDEGGLSEEAESFVQKSNDLLNNINACFKEIQAKIFSMFEVIKEEFISEAQLILTQKETYIKEYNDQWGRQKMKNIIEDTILNREQKELQLMQLNEEFSTQGSKEKVTQILTKLRDLQPKISLESVEIKKDLVNALIQKLSQSFSCGSGKQMLITREAPLPSNNNSLPLSYSRMAIQTKDYKVEGKYIGQLKGEMRHGFGALKLPDGSKYIGEWKDGKMNGQATLTLLSGLKYVGEFKDNKKNGQGIITWQTGKYIGDYSNDKKNGKGIFSWVNGSIYIGEFKEDNFNGQGTKISNTGEIQSGLWKDDKFLGQ